MKDTHTVCHKHTDAELMQMKLETTGCVGVRITSDFLTFKIRGRRPFNPVLGDNDLTRCQLCTHYCGE